MSAPLIFNGRRAKMLTQDGILRSDGSIIDNNGTPNLVKNGHAEINVTGWTVSKNTVAASRPDSGFVTSSTNITWTRNTTNPIDGQADFLYTKDAANRQGEQVYCGFTVAKKHRAKVLQIEVDYLVNSGTFSAGSSSTDSDVIVYIYDVTNSTFIEPSSFKFLSNSSTIADKFIANFQTSATGSSYRILFHQATTYSSAFAVQFKEVRVSPCQYVYGTPISDWVSYTVTPGATNITATGVYRRVGDSLEARVQLVATGVPVGNITASIPSGLTIDTSKLNSASKIGFGYLEDNAIAGYDGFVYYNNTTSVGFSVGNASGTYNTSSGVTTSSPFSWGSTDFLKMQFSAPISGWSSSTQVSDGYDGRVIGLKVNSTGTTGTLNTSDNVVKHAATTINDTTASYSASTGLWTCPRSDWYLVSGSYAISHTTASGYISVSIGVNGTIVAEDYKYVNGAGDSQQSVQSQAIYITAGQTVGLYSKTSLTTPAFTANSKNNWFSIIAAKSPQTMSATEVVAAKYYGIPTGSIGSPHQTITYPTKAFDTHNAYSGGTYTIPVAGIYEVYAYVEVAGTETLGQSVNIATYKNGSVETFMATTRAPGTVSNTGVGGSTLVNCVAGDTIQIKVYTDISSPSYVYADTTPRFEIKRIK